MSRCLGLSLPVYKEKLRLDEEHQHCPEGKWCALNVQQHAGICGFGVNYRLDSCGSWDSIIHNISFFVCVYFVFMYYPFFFLLWNKTIVIITVSFRFSHLSIAKLATAIGQFHLIWRSPADALMYPMFRQIQMTLWKYIMSLAHNVAYIIILETGI